MKRLLRIMAITMTSLLAGCAHKPPTLEPVASVDLPRFMGDWYVIAHIPSRPERQAYNAVESYALDADGRIQTTFRFRNHGFDAPLETMEPVGYVRPETGNAVWGMQFVWPIKAEYIIAYVDPGYRVTIIGRSKRDYAWIMARVPVLEAKEYAALVDRLVAMGYARDAIRKVPQQWPEAQGDRPPLS